MNRITKNETQFIQIHLVSFKIPLAYMDPQSQFEVTKAS